MYWASPLPAQQRVGRRSGAIAYPSLGDRIMRRLFASLTVASLFVVGCSQPPTSPVPQVNPKLSLDCSNGNNGNNPPNTAGGGCNTNNNGNNNNNNNNENNPPTTSGN